MIIASPTLGARNWPTLAKSKLYDASFTHRFRRASASADEQRAEANAAEASSPAPESRKPRHHTDDTTTGDGTDAARPQDTGEA